MQDANNVIHNTTCTIQSKQEEQQKAHRSYTAGLIRTKWLYCGRDPSFMATRSSAESGPAYQLCPLDGAGIKAIKARLVLTWTRGINFP